MNSDFLTPGQRLWLRVVDRELFKARIELATRRLEQWASRANRPGSSRLPSQSPSSSLDLSRIESQHQSLLSRSPLASQGSGFSPFTKVVDHGVNLIEQWCEFAPDVVEHRLHNRGGSRMNCPYCGYVMPPGTWHICTSPTGVTAVQQAMIYPWNNVPAPTIKPPAPCPYCLSTHMLSDPCISRLPFAKVSMPVIGYRAWKTVASYRLGVGNVYRLGSLGVTYNWAPGVNEATCISGRRVATATALHQSVAHPIPDEFCNCGLYVRTNMDELEREIKLWDTGHIVGAVLGWGRLVQHGQEGWRAQYAQIVALLDMKFSPKNDDIAQSVSREYGVPILERKALELYVSEYGNPVEESK